MTVEGLLAPIKELSSDAYAGRLPGTEGETKSVAYLIAQAKKIGLQPGAPDGTWTQTVPLWGTKSKGVLTFKAKDVSATAGQDYVAWSVLPDETVNVPEAELVFAGYGVTASEYKWDDYSGIDVHGKIVAILNGDPPVADPNDPSKLDDKMFAGRALTYYEPGLRPALKPHGFLTRDSRVVERKKYGQPGARRRFQFSKR